MVRITCINKDGGNHQNPYLGITHFGWINPQNNESGKTARAGMVEFLNTNYHGAYVQSPTGKIAYCEVRDKNGEFPYIVTVADGVTTDNLLNLMECR